MGMNHVLMFPFYVHGHLAPMLHLAEVLSKSNHNIHITVINNNFYNFPVQSPQVLEHYSRLPNFRFLSLDIPPEEPHRSLHELIGQEESRRASCREEYRRVLLEPIDGWVPVTCVVADSFVSLALDVPEELGIPIMILHITSAASIWFYYSIPTFLDSNVFPLHNELNRDEEEVHGVPGMEGILRRRDVPSFLMEVAAKGKDDQVLRYVWTTGKNLARAKAIILNTTEVAELPILSLIRSTFPAITYTVGPLHKLVDRQSKNVEDDRVDRTGCLAWLDSKPAKSVVYVCFGTTTRMSKGELVELWHGLVGSGHPFLWVIRKGLLVGADVQDDDDSWMEEADDDQLVAVTWQRGCIVEWAPQKLVLRHPSVGCFVTHGGWNAILEGIDAGMPMICWPFFAEQQMNCRFVVQVWRIGLDMAGPMQRGVVEKLVKEAMDGHELRSSAQALAKLVDQSVEPGGSSAMNCKALMQHIISFGV